MNPHIGSDFDDFLAEQGLLEEVTDAALRRVSTWQEAEASNQPSGVDAERDSSEDPSEVPER